MAVAEQMAVKQNLKTLTLKTKLQMLNLKKWFLNNILIIIGAIAGGIGGYIYYKEIGCSNGTCMISSNPYISTLYFAAIIGFIMSLVKAKIAEDKVK